MINVLKNGQRYKITISNWFRTRIVKQARFASGISVLTPLSVIKTTNQVSFSSLTYNRSTVAEMLFKVL